MSAQSKVVQFSAQTPARPEPLPSAIDAALSRASNAARIGDFSAEMLPSRVRSVLIERQRELNAALRPAHRSLAARALMPLMTMLAAKQDGPAKEEYVVETLINVCDVLPLWAIEETVERFVRGELGKWRPTPDRFSSQATVRVYELRAELEKIGVAVGAAPSARRPDDAARRKALADKLRQTVADGPEPLRATAPTQRGPSARASEAEAAALRDPLATLEALRRDYAQAAPAHLSAAAIGTLGLRAQSRRDEETRASDGDAVSELGANEAGALERDSDA